LPDRNVYFRVLYPSAAGQEFFGGELGERNEFVYPAFRSFGLADFLMTEFLVVCSRSIS
jgi:hypothetical protein